MNYREAARILELSGNFTLEDVKKAYKRLAKKYHPDVSKEKDAEEKFKKVQEAYDYLVKYYENKGSYSSSGRFNEREYESSFSDFKEDFDFYDSFSDLFQSIFGGHPFSSDSGRRRSSYHTRRIVFSAAVDLKLLYEGGWHTIEFDGQKLEVYFEPMTYPVNLIRQVKKGNTTYIVKIDVYSNKYRLHGLDLYTEVEVDYKVLVDGGEIEVEHISGQKIKLQIEPYKGRADRIIKRVPNMGWQMKGENPGDFMVIIVPVF